MQRIITAALLSVASFMAFSSCTKDPLNDMTEDESRIYITNRDSSATFSAYKTFSLADSVLLVDNNRFAGRQATAWDVQLTSAIAAAMEARGFVRVSRSQSPDLGINVSRLYNTTTNVVNLGNYYGGYGGFYDPFYWGYGGFNYNFPQSYGLYQSTEAALSIDVLDLKTASANRTINGVWNGLIRGSGIFRSSNVQSQVQTLFNQSPYLRTTR